MNIPDLVEFVCIEHVALTATYPYGKLLCCRCRKAVTVLSNSIWLSDRQIHNLAESFVKTIAEYVLSATFQQYLAERGKTNGKNEFRKNRADGCTTHGSEDRRASGAA